VRVMAFNGSPRKAWNTAKLHGGEVERSRSPVCAPWAPAYALLHRKPLVIVGKLAQGLFFQTDPLAQDQEVGREKHREGKGGMHQQGKDDELQCHH